MKDPRPTKVRRSVPKTGQKRSSDKDPEILKIFVTKLETMKLSPWKMTPILFQHKIFLLQNLKMWKPKEKQSPKRL